MTYPWMEWDTGYWHHLEACEANDGPDCICREEQEDDAADDGDRRHDERKDEGR